MLLLKTNFGLSDLLDDNDVVHDDDEEHYGNFVKKIEIKIQI